MNYDESDEKPIRRKTNGNQSGVAQFKKKIRIECEQLSRLKSAIGALNRQYDRREVLDVCESDCEQINDLIASPDQQNEEVPTNMTECEAGSSNIVTAADPDDVLLIGLSPTTSVIRTGITPFEVDRDFSLEYTYTVDVSVNSA